MYNNYNCHFTLIFYIARDDKKCRACRLQSCGTAGTEKTRPMKKLIKSGGRKLLSSLLTLCFLFSAFIMPVPASAVTVPTDASLRAQISTVYKRALAYDVSHCSNYARGSFSGKCAHYVHIQLILNGVNTGYVGGNGKDEYDNYKNKTYSTGGKTIHAYPGTRYSIGAALRDISSKAGVATNILVGFEATMTTSGKKYGHAMLITGLIGEYVYFSDSISARFGGVSYAIGDPVKCTIDDFVAYYGRAGVFTYEGIIWFEDTAITAASNGGTPPVDDPGTDVPEPEVPTPTPSVTYTPGEYSVNYKGGLRIRAGAGTGYSTLYILPYRYSAYVTEIKDGFGRIFCSIDGVDYDGWISLAYADREGSLPAVAVEKYGSGGKRISQQWFRDLDSVLDEISAPATLILYADASLTEDWTIGEGITIDAAGHAVTLSGGSVSLRGGSVVSTAAVAAVAADPFVSLTKSGNTYTYTCPYKLTMSTASLLIGNNVALRFKVGATLPELSGAEYRLSCSNLSGGEAEYSASEVGADSILFVTDGIPAKYLGDRVAVTASVSAVSGGKRYCLTSNEMSYSAVEYVGSLYGTSSSTDCLDSMMASMLNYAAAAQSYFDYSEDKLANRALPSSARQLSSGDANIVRAAAAPASASQSTAHVTGASLILSDTVTIRLRAEGLTEGAKLLVWSAADLNALKLQADREGISLTALLTENNSTLVLQPKEGGYFFLENIPAKKFADTYYFRLAETGQDGVKYDSVISYSVTEYCAYMLGNGNADQIDELCRALCDYSAAARSYFGYAIDSES